MLKLLRDEFLLLTLLALLPILLWLSPASWAELPELVNWQTIGALAGLMILSRGLEESNGLALAGQQLLRAARSERMLAAALVLFAAAISTVLTNDVALFIVVPLTLSLGPLIDLPLGRLVIFEALAVNAGSALSPIGNPQNLFLWQSSGVGFLTFTLAMLPLALGLVLLLLAAVPLGFSARSLTLKSPAIRLRPDKKLLGLSLLLYPPMLLLTELGRAPLAALIIGVLFLLLARRVLLGVDWLLLLVFVLMFIDLGLLAALPVFADTSTRLESLPGGIFSAGVLLSQLISNVPAAIFLQTFTPDWRLLAWGVSVGGFGLAIGSLANLIALRLARQPRLWLEFHLWSLPALLLGTALALILLAAG